jgi:uncharacterized protein
MVRLLLDRGVDVNAMTISGSTILMMAVTGFEATEKSHNRFWEKLANLLIRLFGGVPFGPHYPSREADPQIVNLLLQKGADVNAKDRNGETALKKAQRRGSAQIVEMLKKHGAKE